MLTGLAATRVNLKSRISFLQLALADALNPDGQIDIVRHGEAGPKDKAAGGIDFNRHLTPTGWKQVRYLGTKIAKNDYDLGITTGAYRAIETMIGALVDNLPMEKVPPFYTMPGFGFYGPENPDQLADIFRVADQIKHSKYGEFVAFDEVCAWDQFAIEMLEAVPKIVGLKTAKRVFLSNHGLLGSCVAETLLGVYTGGVITDEDRQVLYETEVPLCGVFEISKNGLAFKTYI